VLVPWMQEDRLDIACEQHIAVDLNLLERQGNAQSDEKKGVQSACALHSRDQGKASAYH